MKATNTTPTANIDILELMRVIADDSAVTIVKITTDSCTVRDSMGTLYAVCIDSGKIDYIFTLDDDEKPYFQLYPLFGI